jgi:hypothetical protein
MVKDPAKFRGLAFFALLLWPIRNLVRFAHNWNNGMLECWVKRNENNQEMILFRFFPIMSAKVAPYGLKRRTACPLFHHSILTAQKIATEK